MTGVRTGNVDINAKEYKITGTNNKRGRDVVKRECAEGNLGEME